MPPPPCCMVLPWWIIFTAPAYLVVVGEMGLPESAWYCGARLAIPAACAIVLIVAATLSSHLRLVPPPRHANTNLNLPVGVKDASAVPRCASWNSCSEGRPSRTVFLAIPWAGRGDGDNIRMRRRARRICNATTKKYRSEKTGEVEDEVRLRLKTGRKWRGRMKWCLRQKWIPETRRVSFFLFSSSAAEHRRHLLERAAHEWQL